MSGADGIPAVHGREEVNFQSGPRSDAMLPDHPRRAYSA
jgi:hypothetical protein